MAPGIASRGLPECCRGPLLFHDRKSLGAGLVGHLEPKDVRPARKVLRAELNPYMPGVLPSVDRSGHASPEQVVDGNLPRGGTDRGGQRRTLGLLS